MRTITHAIDTRPFFLLSVLLEKKRPGNEANIEAATTLGEHVLQVFGVVLSSSRTSSNFTNGQANS